MVCNLTLVLANLVKFLVSGCEMVHQLLHAMIKPLALQGLYQICTSIREETDKNLEDAINEQYIKRRIFQKSCKLSPTLATTLSNNINVHKTLSDKEKKKQERAIKGKKAMTTKYYVPKLSYSADFRCTNTKYGF